MKIQEGTMVKATADSSQAALGGVVTQVREASIDDNRVFLASVMFQDEQKTRGVYAFYQEYVYNGKNTRKPATTLITGDKSCPAAFRVEVLE